MANCEFELFVGCYGNGISISNKACMESGDYKKIAFITTYGQLIMYVPSESIPEDDRRRIKEIVVEQRRKHRVFWESLSSQKKYEMLHDYLNVTEFTQLQPIIMSLDTMDEKISFLEEHFKIKRNSTSRKTAA